MDVPLGIQLGLLGTPYNVSPLELSADNVGQLADLCGVYHILSMDSHYDAYVVTGFLPELPPVPGYPMAHPYQRIAGKIRAAGVTGNIGEAVTALLARKTLGLAIGDIAHIRPNQPFMRRKAPDYLLRLGSVTQCARAAFWPKSLAWPEAFATSPDWWPAESKARNTEASSKQAIRGAFRQIAAYWHTLHQSRPAEVGFGLITVFKYQHPATCRAIFLYPTDQEALLARLQATPYKQYLEGLDDDIVTTGALHDC